MPGPFVTLFTACDMLAAPPLPELVQTGKPNATRVVPRAARASPAAKEAMCHRQVYCIVGA